MRLFYVTVFVAEAWCTVGLIDEQKHQNSQKFAKLINQVKDLNMSVEFLNEKYEKMKEKFDTTGKKVSRIDRPHVNDVWTWNRQ